MRRLGWCVVLPFFMLVVSPAWAQPDTRRMLHGLDVVSINIGQLHPDAEGSGLSRTALREELTVNLQQAGVRILGDDGRPPSPDRPELSLAVTIMPIDSFPVYSVSMTLQLRQNACLTRNLIICEPVITWEGASAPRTLSVSQLTDARQDVRALIGRFVTAYLAENPKR